MTQDEWEEKCVGLVEVVPSRRWMRRLLVIFFPIWLLWMMFWLLVLGTGFLVLGLRDVWRQA